jgi:hypothetical protein
MTQRRGPQLWLLIIGVAFSLLVGAPGAEAVIYGLKTKAKDPQPSEPPTILFSFEEDGSNLTNISYVKLDGKDLDADGLAYDNVYGYGLLAFELQTNAGGAVEASRLIKLDPASGAVTVQGTALAGRNIRGAVFVRDQLWVLDTASNELLRVNPLTGEVMVQKSLQGTTLAAGVPCDLALRRDGSVYLVNLDTFFSLDLATGQTTLFFTPPGSYAYPGLAFSMKATTNTLFGYEVNGRDEINTLDADNHYALSVLIDDVFNGLYNAGRGDLASAMQPISNSAGISLLLLDQ